MSLRFGRRALLTGAAATLAATGLAGCIPSLSAKTKNTVNVALITYSGGGEFGGGGFGGMGSGQSSALYQAALAVTKQQQGNLDINVSTITATVPTPAARSAQGVQGVLSGAQSAAATALKQALGQDPAPDVVLFDTATEFGLAIQDSLLQTVETYARNDSTLKSSDFFPAAITAASDKGHLYGLPLAVEPTLLQYDKQLFDAAQVAIPDSTWNWNTLLNAAKALTNPNATGGAQYGLSASGVSAIDLVSILVWQNGGEVISQDGSRSLIAEAPGVGAIQFLYDLYNTYKVVAPIGSGGGNPGFQRSSGGVGSDTGPAMMAQGRRVAMQLANYGPYGRMGGGRNSSLQLAVLPKGKVAATSLTLYGVLAMTSQASDPPTAYRAMVALAAEMQKGMTVPAHRPTALKISTLNPNVTADQAKMLVDALDNARAIPVSLTSKLTAPFSQNILQPIVTGGKTPSEIASAAADAIDQVLNS